MPRELPLNPLWEHLGATLKTEKDWKIPSIFRDFLSEYQAVRKRIGLADFSFRGKISVTGKDRVSFLHNLLTNDIKSLGLGDGCYAALLSAAGKVLVDFNVYVFANFILLDTELGYEKKVFELLQKFIITEDVKLSDVTEQFAHAALLGKRSEVLAQALFPGHFPDFAEFHHANFHLGDSDVILIRQSRSGAKGFHLLIPAGKADRVAERVLLVGKLYGLAPIGFGTAEIIRMEAGIPRYGIDVDENVSLGEAALDDLATSETKGCYPGQEVVARTKTYGGLQRKLIGLTFQKGPLPAAGDKIVTSDAAEKEIGWITSACASPALEKGIALGYLAKGYFEKSIEVRIKSRGNTLPAVTDPQPFTALSRAGQPELS